jgi:hypothetical protein
MLQALFRAVSLFLNDESNDDDRGRLPPGSPPTRVLFFYILYPVSNRCHSQIRRPVVRYPDNFSTVDRCNIVSRILLL